MDGMPTRWLWLRAVAVAAGVVLGAVPMVSAQTISFSTVVIDPGHGGTDGGAAWYGLVEKKLNLDLAQRLEKILRVRGLKVVMTRSSDKTVELGERAQIANRNTSAIFVSLHFNANLNRSISGFETFYRSANGKTIARAVQRQMDNQLVGTNRGVTHSDFKVLKETRMPAVLIECGFLSHFTESKRCGSATHRQKLAYAIADGITGIRRK